MALSRRIVFFGSLVALAGLTGCPGPDDPHANPDAAHGDASVGPVIRCSRADDPDMDNISSMDEDLGDSDGDGIPNPDADGDGIPNRLDTDSDGDGVPDVTEAGDADCTSPPRDLDGDHIPDYLDLDANADGIADNLEATTDRDGDGILDALDLDVDGDGISNAIEYGPPGPTPTDTDGDGEPDVFDLDSDGDTILDAQEGSGDLDEDGVPNFRDLDSDGDGIEDTVEAGDGLLMTPPVQCPNEIDPVTGLVSPDGLADAFDFDSDNDGLGDRDELVVGTDPCNVDTDGDGQGDLAEGAYVLTNCPDGMTGTDCNCAHAASCGIPAEHFFVVLPYHTPPIDRDLEFGTSIRVADVFFMTDTTGSMGGTLANVQATVTTPVTGIIDRIIETIPDAWVGGGGHSDMPFASYDSSPYEPFHLAIRMTPPSRSADVRTAFSGISLTGGGDGPEAQVFAIHQTVTGRGGTWMGSGPTYTMRAYEGDCLDVGWGAPCFREAALPIIILFTDICSHNGPPGDCDDYVGITPAPPTFAEAVAAMNVRGARFIGINASGGESCATVTGPSGYSPCWMEKQMAQETGSVDLDGNELVYDLPNSSTREAFTNTVVEAIETIATRVPLDITTRLRDDTSDPQMVDARQFIFSRRPACRAGIDPCWTEPTGITHDDAVATYDESTFFGVIPGTRVLFRIQFRNDFYPGGRNTELYKAFIDVTAGGSAVLDTRQVYIVIPANPVPFG